MSRSPSKTDRAPEKTFRASRQSGASRLLEVLPAALDKRRRRFLRRVGQARRHPTEKAIHDLRVATRRLIAVVDVVRALQPENGARRLRRRLKRHLDAFRELRDLQVLILASRHLVRSFAPLNPFLATLLREERRLLKRAAGDAARMHGGTLERLLERVNGELQHGLSEAVAEASGRAIAVGSLAQAYARANSLLDNTGTGDTAAIHRLRLSFKKYRYMVEVLQPLLPGVDRQMLKRMRHYQTMMGEIQDLEVLWHRVKEFSLQHGTQSAKSFLPLEQHLLKRRDTLVAGFRTAAGELHAFWLPHW